MKIWDSVYLSTPCMRTFWIHINEITTYFHDLVNIQPHDNDLANSLVTIISCWRQVRKIGRDENVSPETSTINRRPRFLLVDVNQTELFYWSTSTTELDQTELLYTSTSTTELFYWSTSTRLSFCTGRRRTLVVDSPRCRRPFGLMFSSRPKNLSICGLVQSAETRAPK